MKKFLFIAVIGFLFTTVTQAQTLRNSGVTETLVKKVTTTNATPTTIASVAIGADEVGFITIKMVGLKTAYSSGVTGIRTYRYSKHGGTLTLGSAVETQAIVADSAANGATFAASASSNNVIVQVTGLASTTMYWRAVIKVYGIIKD